MTTKAELKAAEDKAVARAEFVSSLPVLEKGFFWRVKYEPERSNTKPMVLELRESYTPGTKSVNKLRGYERTIASAKALAEAADLILARHRDQALFVGDFGVFDD